MKKAHIGLLPFFFLSLISKHETLAAADQNLRQANMSDDQEESSSYQNGFETAFSSDDAGSSQMKTYGNMFELHVSRTLIIYEMSIHTSKTDDVEVIIYTSPGELDYIRHPTAWDWHQNATVVGAGAGVRTIIPRGLFIPITITKEMPILSCYISLTERAMLTTEVTSAGAEDSLDIAFQNDDIAITYGFAKIWHFADIEGFSLFNGGFWFTRDSLPPTHSPTVSSMPTASSQKPSMQFTFTPSEISSNMPTASSLKPSAQITSAPSEIRFVEDNQPDKQENEDGISLLNITGTFEGGKSIDGIMFDLYARSEVKLYSMDIITTSLGKVEMEIYVRKGSWTGRDKMPSAWSLIAAFDLQSDVLLEPLRIPDNSFDPIEMFPGDLISFYITTTNGAYIQMTPHPISRHESTNELIMYAGIGKKYPFLYSDVGMAWNGRIYYHRVGNPAPTQAPVADVPSQNSYCGIDREDALICDTSCQSSLDCSMGETCFENIDEDDCEGEVFNNWPPEIIENEDIEECNVPDFPFEIPESISSTFAGGDATHGSMFDIVVTKDIAVKEIDIHVNQVGAIEIELYATCCNVHSYTGVRRHPTAWNLVGSVTAMGKGTGVPTSLSASMMLEGTCISALEGAKGFYITATGGPYMLQTPGGNEYATGDVYKSNADLSLMVGIGKRYFLLNEKKDMIFNGNIRYSILDGNDKLSGNSEHSASSSLISLSDLSSVERLLIMLGLSVMILV